MFVAPTHTSFTWSAKVFYSNARLRWSPLLHLANEKYLHSTANICREKEEEEDKTLTKNSKIGAPASLPLLDEKAEEKHKSRTSQPAS